LFQCSSASRKFLNRTGNRNRCDLKTKFQCSSASRKFLNLVVLICNITCKFSFQCSSASRKFLNNTPRTPLYVEIPVSVLFSEPKIPQCRGITVIERDLYVSVLFSEPKIPQ